MHDGNPPVYPSLRKESSVWVLRNEKVKSFEYAVNTDSPPLSVFFPTIGIRAGSSAEA